MCVNLCKSVVVHYGDPLILIGTLVEAGNAVTGVLVVSSGKKKSNSHNIGVAQRYLGLLTVPGGRQQ